MKNHNIISTALLVFVLLLAACAHPPVEEMNLAHDAVFRAENDANAVTHAGPVLTRARDALTRMQSEADARRFDAARDFAAEAVSLAERAIADGRTGAARARDEATNIITALNNQLAEVTRALSAAEQARNLNIDYDTLSRDLDAARRSEEAARQNFAAGHYGDATIWAQNGRALLSDMNARLNQAAQAAVRK